MPFAGPALAFHGADYTVTVQVINPFRQRLMRVGLTDQDEFEFFVQRRPEKRLVTVKIIAEHGRA